LIASPPQACLSTAIQKARDRQRLGTGADLDCSRSYIGKLEVEGVILRQGDGFPLDQSRVAYLRYLRREHRQPRAEADADHVKVKTDVADQDHGEAAQALVRRDAVDKLIDAMCGTVLTHLSGMSARCSRDMVVRRNIDAVVHQIRREMAAACLAKADQSSSVTDCGICRKRSRCRAQ
jgi:hypothetical protein